MSELEALIALMVKYRVLRMHDGTRSVELHPSAFEPRPSAEDSSPEGAGEMDGPCGCGHASLSAHDAHGECLMGCSSEKCKPSEGTE